MILFILCLLSTIASADQVMGEAVVRHTVETHFNVSARELEKQGLSGNWDRDRKKFREDYARGRAMLQALTDVRDAAAELRRKIEARGQIWIPLFIDIPKTDAIEVLNGALNTGGADASAHTDIVGLEIDKVRKDSLALLLQDAVKLRQTAAQSVSQADGSVRLELPPSFYETLALQYGMNSDQVSLTLKSTWLPVPTPNGTMYVAPNGPWVSGCLESLDHSTSFRSQLFKFSKLSEARDWLNGTTDVWGNLSNASIQRLVEYGTDLLENQLGLPAYLSLTAQIRAMYSAVAGDTIEVVDMGPNIRATLPAHLLYTLYRDGYLGVIHVGEVTADVITLHSSCAKTLWKVREKLAEIRKRAQ